MEGYTYVDIFASKGIEYLLVIGYLMVFTLFWVRLSKPAKAIVRAARKIVPAIREWFRLPEGFFYHQGHSWARPEGEVVKVGMDDFAQKLVGKINAVRLPEVGSTVIQGEEGWSLTVDSKSIPMLSPVNGKVVDVNEDLLRSPEKIQADPYGDAWFMKVRVPRASSNLRNLLSGELAKRWMDQVRKNLVTRMTGEKLGLVYQDGGLPVQGMARSIDPENWDKIVKDFFGVSQGGV